MPAGTEILAQRNEKRVKLIINRRGAAVLKKSLNIMVIVRFEQTDPLPNPAGVGVDNKDGIPSGVKQNRIRGLRADAVEGEKTLAQTT
jgi:hypothetical protein